ncbi:hypothetical protein CSB37_03140 [bacterium DOLZORAL124_38_8]|nr:MAG: hypothetical protein CSB37_03140 [bacterium DOLZORAL124_38_8]
MIKIVNKILLTILFGVSFGLTTTQAFEYEIIKTPQAPGFFSVTLLADKQNEGVCSELLIIKNFSPKEAPDYTSLINQIQQVNQENTQPCSQKIMVKEFEYLGRKTPALHQKVIILGEPFQDYPHFSISEHNPKKLRSFLETEAQPEIIVLANPQIIAKDTQNISEIITNLPNISMGNPFIISGKFKKSQPTQIEIIGKNPRTNFPAKFTIHLNLENQELANHPFAKDLPTLWNSLSNKSSHTTPKSTPTFIWILALLGTGLLLLLLVKQYKNHQQKKLKLKSYLSTSPQTIKKSAPINVSNLPFEIEDKK